LDNMIRHGFRLPLWRKHRRSVSRYTIRWQADRIVCTNAGRRTGIGVAMGGLTRTSWVKGQSGNPRGRARSDVRTTAAYHERIAALRSELEATGVPLTIRETMDLDLAVVLSLRQSKSLHNSAQAASVQHRLLNPLYRRRQAASAPLEPLRDRLIRERAERLARENAERDQKAVVT
jgi:hypothetical protein